MGAIIKWVLLQLEMLLQQLPPETAKKAIDAALDAVEKALEKDGLTAWEKVAIEALKYLRKTLAITEEPGSPYSDA